MLTSLALLAASAALPTPQSNVTVLYREGMTLPDGRTVTETHSGPEFDRTTGGFFVALCADGGPIEIWHDPDGIGPADLALFHIPTPPPMHTLERVRLDAAGGGRLAWYRETQRTTLGITIQFVRLMVDQTVGWRPSDPTPIPGASWQTTPLRQLAFNDQGDFLMRETVSLDGGGSVDLIANLTTQEVILKEGDLIEGTNTLIQGIGLMKLSPSGTRIATNAYTGINPCFNGTGLTWLIVDGAPIYFGGQAVRTGVDIPSGAGSASGERVEFGYFASINDAGDAAYALDYGTPCAFPTSYALFRNNQFLGGTDTPALHYPGLMFGMGLVGGTNGIQLDVEGRPIAGPTSPVDVDGDGVADPGWSLHSLGPITAVGSGYQLDAFDQIYAKLRIREAGSAPVDALVYVEDPFVGSAYCPGVTNSSGRAAELVGVGSDEVTRNDFSLVAHRMPRSSFGYALVSETQGFVAQPNGSQGNLCLNGDIGRFAGSIFDSGTAGSAVTDVDLSALPQPMGTAAAMAGESWNFQVWFRDVAQGQATSNFTEAIEVQLR